MAFPIYIISLVVCIIIVGVPTELVWLLDGNVKYFQDEHIVLGIVALLIILIGFPFTALLLSWQWFVRAPRWKIFRWISNTKLNVFIATYHAPYNSKYRYWTGLLLFVRVLLYIIAAATLSTNPQISLVLTILVVGGLSFLGGYGMYKNMLVAIVQKVMDFNLLALATLTLYDFDRSDLK